MLAENNAWDFNVGASAVYRGLRAGVYVTELGARVGAGSARSRDRAAGLLQLPQVRVHVGWQSNILALVHGDFLQKRADRLARERDLLLEDIGERQRRLPGAAVELDRYEAQNLLELEQRRGRRDPVEAERDALRRLEERLKRLEQQRTPPPSPQP